MRLYCIILLSATLLCCSSSSKKITNDSNLKSLQVFAKSYSPSLENKENLPIPPKEIVSSLENTKHSKEKEKYLVTILLKLYQSHLSCCNQSYELRNDKDRMEVNNLILKNYLEGTQQYDLEKPIE